MVQGGLSQRLASPGLFARMPGLKMLPLSVAPPKELFWFPRICSRLTICGVHPTRGFHDALGENVGIGAMASSPKFRLYGGVVPSVQMIPNALLPLTEAE